MIYTTFRFLFDLMRFFLTFFIFIAASGIVCCQVDTVNLKKQFLELKEASKNAFNRGNYTESQIINQNLLKLADSLKDEEFLSVGYRYISYDFITAGDTTRAKQSLKTAISHAQNANNQINLADTYLLEASLNEQTKAPFENVLASYNKSIAIYKKENDFEGLGISYLNLIETCFVYKEYDLAYRYLKKNKSITEQHIPQDIYYYYKQLAYYHLKKKNYEQAEYYLDFAENHESFTKSMIDVEKIYSIRSSIYFEKGAHKKAYEALIVANDAAKKNQQEIHTVELEKVTTTFEIERYKKDALINKKNSDLQNELITSKNQINTFLILLSTLSLLVILFLIYVFLNRKKLIDKLKLKNTEYLDAKEESERLAASKSSFFNTVSHELRTPLYGVIGMSTLLLEDPEIPSDNKENLKTLKFSADYLLALVNDVLQLGKIDANKIPLESSIINIKALISSLLSTFEYSKTQNNNIFKIDISSNVPEYFKGNSMILKQVLMNLVSNATKFTENGTILINVIRHQHNELKISIIDDGPGIPLSKQQAVFSEFAQLKNANSYYGTGLGLPIVLKLLSILGSKIELDSTCDKGSSFSFKFPIDEVNVSENLKSLTPHILVDKTFDGKKILVVDDNTINQIVTSKILIKLKAECAIARDGREAVNLVQEQAFDLILMDVNMPVLDGFEATEEIRLLGYDMPIIALTAVEAEDVRLKSVECGMNGYIIKPYDIKDFKRTIAINLAQYDVNDTLSSTI